MSTAAGDFDEDVFTRRRIEAACERALAGAGVAGVFPTPLDEIARLANIREIIDISQLPGELVVAKPSWLRKLLGALDFRSRTVFVDQAQCVGKVRWTKAHETTHGLLPWHEASAFLDDHERLFQHSEEAREVEANIGAGHLIFQGHRYMERALSFRPSLAAPIEVAGQVGASLHSSIRYYTEHHPEPAALLIGGRFEHPVGHLPIFTAVESRSFRERFGAASGLLPSGSIPTGDGVEPRFVSDAAREARIAAGSVAVEASIGDVNGERHDFVAEFFSNRYSMFLFLLPKKRIRLGRRLQLITTT